MSHPYELFGIHQFSESVMKEHLPHPVFKAWKTALQKEEALDRNTADAIAHAMKVWAIGLGATHFTHWFQPLHGSTAEKHDAFISRDDQGTPVTRFSGKTLIKGETDGSSFPSGGLRATFEARGYTYWDISSPAFIRDNVLCIPSIFISYHGEPLDQKAPLLSALDVMGKEATRVVSALGDKQVKDVKMLMGLEQEYFLVDYDHYVEREDLVLSGRTLVGAASPKGQEFEDHYFGSIPSKVKAYMDEVNLELWKMGIFAFVEHNEVAPSQFEISSIFTDANIAVDQNQLTMDVLRKVAKKHDLACLLHEKPFKGINGSGKHNNWSLSTDDGQNLFEPGDKPSENVRFLLFVAAVIKAIDEHPELLRLAASGAGNDHRLGANEAPPAIISVFMGEVIEEILLSMVDKSNAKSSREIKSSPLSNLAYLPKDNTDRNRTSPFAFTGNKFEFRMLGSSLSGSTSATVIATILADTLREFANRLEPIKYLQDVRDEALKIVTEVIEKHHRVLFSGDGYSEAWVKEAEKRGLPNIPSFVEAIEHLTSKKTLDLFERNKIYTHQELDARADILYEQYLKTLQVEAKTMIRMVDNAILPASIDYLTSLQDLPFKSAQKKLKAIDTQVNAVDEKLEDLKEALAKVSAYDDTKKASLAQRTIISPKLDALRTEVDALESLLPTDVYPYPSYMDMWFRQD
jgi:glutamine synthetase